MKHFLQQFSALLLASMSSLAAEVVPYVHDFNDADCLQEWSVLAHSDRVRFIKYVEAHQAPVYGYRNCVCSNSIYSGGSIETKDSWLISPAISLEGGKRVHRYLPLRADKYGARISGDILWYRTHCGSHDNRGLGDVFLFRKRFSRRKCRDDSGMQNKTGNHRNLLYRVL